MPPFATESGVRLRFQLTDTTLVPADLIADAIANAHIEVERFLDPDVDTETPEPGLVSGETLLAGAHLYRALAAKDAFQQRNISIGGHRIEEGERFRALNAVAALTEKQAWYLLEPYVAEYPVRIVLDATDSIPVFGES